MKIEKKHDIFNFVLFFQKFFGNSASVVVPISFKIICSSSVKNVLGILIENELNQ